MTLLTPDNLGSFGLNVTKPAYDRKALRPGIVHFGVGNFHRAHQGIAIEACLHRPNQQDWAICGVGLTGGASARAKAEAYSLQGNLYSVTKLTSPTPRQTQVVGAMVEYLHAPQSPATVLQRLADPGTRIVSLTITEGGYNLDEVTGEFRLDAPGVREDLTSRAPTTVFGYLVGGLRKRWEARLPPFTVMSCDNLPRNGDAIRRGVISYARALDPALAKWIEENGTFPNSMVDRIAPQVSEEERRQLALATGVDDRVACTCETYSSWVMEDRFSAGRPDLEVAGVIFSDEVSAYVSMKGRLSNAAHSMMCYPALLMGCRFVDEAMRRPEIPRLLRNFWDFDAYRLVPVPEGVSARDFTTKVLERFGNPAIKDHLLRICGDGASKIGAFLGQTTTELIGSGGDLTREAFLVACFGRYLRRVDDQGEHFEIYEPRITESDWRHIRGGDHLAVLDIEALRGLGLRQSSHFVDAFSRLTRQLDAEGVAPTLQQLLV